MRITFEPILGPVLQNPDAVVLTDLFMAADDDYWRSEETSAGLFCFDGAGGVRSSLIFEYGETRLLKVLYFIRAGSGWIFRGGQDASARTLIHSHAGRLFQIPRDCLVDRAMAARIASEFVASKSGSCPRGHWMELMTV